MNVQVTERPQYLCWDLYVSWAAREQRERAAHHFCACTHILSWQEWNKLTHALIYIYSPAHTHSHCDTLSFFLSPSLTQNPQTTSTLYAQITMSGSNVFSALWLIVRTSDANIKEMTDLAQPRFLMITLLAEYGLMHRGDCINCETCYFCFDPAFVWPSLGHTDFHST